MKKHYAVNETGEICEVSFSHVLGEGILAIIDAGLDEGVTGWSSVWNDIDNDDLESFLNQGPTPLSTVLHSLLGDIESRLRKEIERKGSHEV